MREYFYSVQLYKDNVHIGDIGGIMVMPNNKLKGSKALKYVVQELYEDNEDCVFVFVAFNKV